MLTLSRTCWLLAVSVPQNTSFQQIKLHVPPQFQNKVVRPMDSVAAIVKGAVTAGITERVVTSRVARRHYLMATLQPFKEGHHPEQYRVPSLDGKDRCKYTRQIFVQKGQRVKIGEPVKGIFLPTSGTWCNTHVRGCLVCLR